jgi:glycosyltransferase involved in cell wall biosynthesis
MKVIILGTRGIPDIQGGIETHCQELYPRLVELGADVTVITRKVYVNDLSILEYRGVKLKHIFSPKKKSLEAIIHTFLGILYARMQSPNILHIHAIGPSLLVPFAKLLGLKVVVTNHGPDYDRQKWGKIAKKVLILGERLGTKYANKVIVISTVINDILKNKYSRNDCELIYNGVDIPVKSIKDDYIKSLGLRKNNYIIAVGRFVEEKGFHDLISAYKLIETSVQLVLVGDADHESKYSLKLKDDAKNNNIILTGFIKGEKLNQIFSHAKLFVMPSYHEGLPIALLEAMSYNLDILVSDIPANLEVNLDKNNYFEVGNIENLKLKLIEKLRNSIQKDFVKIIEDKYNWNKISKKTYFIYQKLL